MEPLLIIGVPGLLGGVLLALVLMRVRVRPGSEERPLAPPSPALINMAHIRVDGLGGLGMVAMAITVAIFVPRIRLTMAIALVLGMGLAALLIARRRRQGPLPSSSEHSGAHSMFIAETPQEDARRPPVQDRGSASQTGRLQPAAGHDITRQHEIAPLSPATHG